MTLKVDRRDAGRGALAECDSPSGQSKLHRIRISPADLQKRHLVGLPRSGNRRVLPLSWCSRSGPQTLPARSAKEAPECERATPADRQRTRGDEGRAEGMRERERGFVIRNMQLLPATQTIDNRFPNDFLRLTSILVKFDF